MELARALEERSLRLRPEWVEACTSLLALRQPGFFSLPMAKQVSFL